MHVSDANKGGADQPAHRRSRICAFVGRCGVADLISVNLIRKKKLIAFVTEQADLKLTGSVMYILTAMSDQDI